MYRATTAANAETMKTQPIDWVTVAMAFATPVRIVGVNPRAAFGVAGGNVGGAVVVVVVVDVVDVFIGAA